MLVLSLNEAESTTRNLLVAKLHNLTYYSSNLVLNNLVQNWALTR